MNYEKYKKSRDCVWQLLIEHGVTSLPVRVSQICKAEGVKIVSFANAPITLMKLNSSRSDGFTLQKTIFYNEQCPISRQRFTVAHELGHIFLHGGSGIYNREPCATDLPLEQEANVFASRLLAPACVLWALNVRTASQIANLCNISMQSAIYRMKRLKLLYKRQLEFEQQGKSCFLQSDLEKQVFKQFQDYIYKNRFL